MVENANGSIYLESGDIQLQCTVHGPRPIRGSFVNEASFNVEVKIAPFNVDAHNTDVAQQVSGGITRPNGTSNLEKEMSSFIETSLIPAIKLEDYPKSTIDLFVTVLSRGSNPMSLYAAGVNAGSVALTNAGIALRDIVTCGSAVIPETGSSNVYVDPEHTPLIGDISMVISYMTAVNEEIVGLKIDGGFLSEPQLKTCLESTFSVAKDIRAVVNRLLITEFRSKEKTLLDSVKRDDDTMDIDS